MILKIAYIAIFWVHIEEKVACTAIFAKKVAYIATFVIFGVSKDNINNSINS